MSANVKSFVYEVNGQNLGEHDDGFPNNSGNTSDEHKKRRKRRQKTGGEANSDSNEPVKKRSPVLLKEKNHQQQCDCGQSETEKQYGSQEAECEEVVQGQLKSDGKDEKRKGVNGHKRANANHHLQEHRSALRRLTMAKAKMAHLESRRAGRLHGESGKAK